MSSTRTSLKVRASQAIAVASLAGFMLVGGTAGAQAASGGGATPSGGFSPAACSSTGGGTWCRGTSADGVLKRCYSNYSHPSNYHSSTAVLASGTDKGYANAGYFSYADVTAGWAYTCYTYWNNAA